MDEKPPTVEIPTAACVVDGGLVVTTQAVTFPPGTVLTEAECP